MYIYMKVKSAELTNINTYFLSRTKFSLGEGKEGSFPETLIILIRIRAMGDHYL